MPPLLSFSQTSDAEQHVLSFPKRTVSGVSVTDVQTLSGCCNEHTEGAPWPTPDHVGSVNLFGATTNLVLAVLGAGQLTLPYALRELGLVTGISVLFLFTFLSAHSLNVLATVATHFRPHAQDCIESYAELVVRVLGPVGKIICSTLIAIYAWGGAVSFLIILKGEFSYLLMRLGVSSVSGELVMVLVTMIVIWPLCSARDISALKRVAPLGCMAALFITLVMLLCASWGGSYGGATACSGPSASAGLLPNAGEIQLWPASFLRFSAALPLFAFALNSSWAFVPILCTLEDKSKLRKSRLINGANAIILANYVLLAFYGYVTFCGAIEPNILDSLGKSVTHNTWQGYFVFAARASLATQLTLALPMRFFVARRTICGDVMHWQTAVRRFTVSAALTLSAAGIAATPIELTQMLGITSSICASMIIYILPAIIDLRHRLPGTSRLIISALSLPVGVFILIAGTVANVLGVSVGG